MCGPTAGCTATLVATAATPGCRLPPSSALFTTQASALLSLVALRKEEVGNGEGIQEDMSEGACRGGGRGGHIMVVLRPSFHASTNRNRASGVGLSSAGSGVISNMQFGN